MVLGGDPYATRRVELLDPVARFCAESGVDVRVGELRTARGDQVAALVCTADDGSWDAAVTVVRATPAPDRDGVTFRRYVRDPVAGYRLDAPGEVADEVRVTEDDDGGTGHGPRPVVRFQLLDDARAAADDLILWARRPSLFHADPPQPDAARIARRLNRQFDNRQAAAATPRVHMDASLPKETAADVAALDLPALCWHFPRESSGLPQRSATVALTSYGGHATGSRARWLVARAHPDGLGLGVADLIGANQRHRWDLTRWLWDRRAAGTPLLQRWQVPDVATAAPACAAVDAGRVGEALSTAGVEVDDQIGKLLTGAPTRLYRAEFTDKWVARLYAGLGEAAPWRLASAYAAWAAQRAQRSLPARRPVALFGLGGVVQQRKPLVALDGSRGAPTLRLVFSGSNEVLPRSLWTVPDDLAARVYGWTPIID